jgi:hypothetical protein
MAARSSIWTAAVLGVAFGALVGGGIALAASAAKSARLQDALTTQTDLRSKADSRAEKAEADLATARAEIDALRLAAKSPTSGSQTSAQATETPAGQGSQSQPVRQFTFVHSVSTGSSPKIVADYAQFLTGKPAADAATAHGDESPPPNDYYIVNDNKKLRTLPVKAGISVKLVSKADGTTDAEGYLLPLDKWAANFAAPTMTNSGIISAGYWVTLKDGVVVAIEEQYVP